MYCIIPLLLGFVAGKSCNSDRGCHNNCRRCCRVEKTLIKDCRGR
ncbi:MAG: hypothetical protein PHV71_00035 [Eubacteriales bacterium]|nr:hypothetical protein [Eubacteriales bacterium]MDD3198781.1 hypothetical protein [Eubacteriales bacterium]MDD4628973.1 hypothetical protein [Eubacteriales bacterium]